MENAGEFQDSLNTIKEMASNGFNVNLDKAKGKKSKTVSLKRLKRFS